MRVPLLEARLLLLGALHLRRLRLSPHAKYTRHRRVHGALAQTCRRVAGVWEQQLQRRNSSRLEGRVLPQRLAITLWRSIPQPPTYGKLVRTCHKPEHLDQPYALMMALCMPWPELPPPHRRVLIRSRRTHGALSPVRQQTDGSLHAPWSEIRSIWLEDQQHRTARWMPLRYSPYRPQCGRPDRPYRPRDMG